MDLGLLGEHCGGGGGMGLYAGYFVSGVPFIVAGVLWEIRQLGGCGGTERGWEQGKFEVERFPG